MWHFRFDYPRTAQDGSITSDPVTASYSPAKHILVIGTRATVLALSDDTAVMQWRRRITGTVTALAVFAAPGVADYAVFAGTGIACSECLSVDHPPQHSRVYKIVVTGESNRRLALSSYTAPVAEEPRRISGVSHRAGRRSGRYGVCGHECRADLWNFRQIGCSGMEVRGA